MLEDLDGRGSGGGSVDQKAKVVNDWRPHLQFTALEIITLLWDTVLDRKLKVLALL